MQGMLTEEVSGTELVRIEQVEEAEASARWQNAAAAGKIPSAREQEAAAIRLVPDIIGALAQAS